MAFAFAFAGEVAGAVVEVEDVIKEDEAEDEEPERTDEIRLRALRFVATGLGLGTEDVKDAEGLVERLPFPLPPRPCALLFGLSDDRSGTATATRVELLDVPVSGREGTCTSACP